MTSWQFFLVLLTWKSIPDSDLSHRWHWDFLSQRDGNIAGVVFHPLPSLSSRSRYRHANTGSSWWLHVSAGFQPEISVEDRGTAWEGRLFCRAPISCICGTLRVMPVVPVSWCFKSRTMKRAASTAEGHYSAWLSTCFYYKSYCFNSFSENTMPLESGDCKKISNLLSKLILKRNKGRSLENLVHKDHKCSYNSEFHACLALKCSS